MAERLIPATPAPDFTLKDTLAAGQLGLVPRPKYGHLFYPGRPPRHAQSSLRLPRFPRNSSGCRYEVLASLRTREGSRKVWWPRNR